MSVDLQALEIEIATERARIARLETIKALMTQAEGRAVPSEWARAAVEAAVEAWPVARFQHFMVRRQFVGQALTHGFVGDRTHQDRRELQRDMQAFISLALKLPDGREVAILDARNCLYGNVGSVLWLDADPELPEKLLAKLEDTTAMAARRASENHWSILAALYLGRQLAESVRRHAFARARKEAARLAQLQLRIFGTGTDSA